ncbi:uncharacterized protein LOC134531266 [Bacillus rossius redtenbacheri]|uniref:uncharacterized protein LOC134531266 n=1 Tax=Bacillus rossius redtenbacheri TaxID=93214 RepID=UPI002FDD1FDA
MSCVSAVASLASLAWAVAAYTRAMRRARAEKLAVTWPGLLLQASWRAGMLAARVAALVLFAVGFRAWVFLLVGVHWLGMTTWVLLQKTDFCETPAEERVYNCVVGVIYCFCFFNLQEGRSRRRIFAFYTIIIAQNIGCLCLYVTVLGHARPDVFKFATSTVVGGTLIGMSSMLLYYRFFHPTGPIKLCDSRELGCSEEHDSKSQLHPVQSATLRSLKHLWVIERNNDSSSRLDDLVQHQEEDACSLDKKLLLMHCSAETSLPCAAAGNEGSNSPKERPRLPLPGEAAHTSSADQGGRETLSPRRQRLPLPDERIQPSSLSPQGSMESPKLKRQRMPLPDEVTEPSLQNLSGSSNPPAQRQRLPLPNENPQTSCKTEELGKDKLEVTENESISIQKYKVNSPPVENSVVIKSKCENNRAKNVLDKNLHKKKKCRGIYSTEDIVSQVVVKIIDSEETEDKNKVLVTVGCERFEQKCKSCPNGEVPLPSLGGEMHATESEGTPSEILSVPSEVLSAHDYENLCAVNIAREAWGLRSWRGYADIETWLHDDSIVRDRRRDTLTSTTSSENSALSSGSPPPVPSRRLRQEEYLDTLVYDLSVCMVDPEPDPTPGVFVARPYVVDQHGTLFPLQTLDTITEELEESSSSDLGERLGRCHGSASTLVATIDEIRLGDLYNLADEQWETSTQPSTCEDLYPPSPLLASHVQPHLLTEEVLFLSKLKPLPEASSTSSSSVASDSPQKVDETHKNISQLDVLRSSPVHDDAVSKESPTVLQQNLTCSLSCVNTQKSKCNSVTGSNSSSLADNSNSPTNQNSNTSFHPNSSLPAVMSSKTKPVPDYSLPRQEVSPLRCSESSVGSNSPENPRQGGRRNRPRRKFSLIREKFETKQCGDESDADSLRFPPHLDASPSDAPLTAVYSEPLPDDMTTKILMESEPVVRYNKDSALPVPSRIKQWNTLLKSQNATNLRPSPEPAQVIPLSGGPEQEPGKTWPGLASLRERRSMFLKQVLSPPKFSSWSRRGSVSPTSKVVPAL